MKAEDLKARAKISEVVAQILPDEDRYKRNIFYCPFHDDLEPILMVNDDEGFFKCFVCDSAGDVISFVMTYEKCAYNEALIRLDTITKMIERRKI